MSNRRLISLAAVAALGIACISADAFAARGAGSRGGAVANRGSAVANRAGAVGYRGAAGYRGAVANRGAVAYRGGLNDRGYYGGGYYRPGLGLAAGAVVAGAVGAGYGYGYGPGNYGYDQGYPASNYTSSYDNGYGQGYYGNQAYPASYTTSGNGSAPAAAAIHHPASDVIVRYGDRCWVNSSFGNPNWVAC
jgi:hypothetical protein